MLATLHDCLANFASNHEVVLYLAVTQRHANEGAQDSFDVRKQLFLYCTSESYFSVGEILYKVNKNRVMKQVWPKTFANCSDTQ